MIGTTYKKQSREAAIKAGLPLFGSKMLPMIEKVENWISTSEKKKDTTKPTLYIHCWRGGMRSAAVAWLLDLYGYKVVQLTMENIKQTSEQLNEFSRIASQSPASLIWGEPPAKIILPMNGTQGQSGVQK